MPRHLVGVPRARNLTVNGVPTKSGSPHAAVRRIYKSATRPLADTHAPAPVVLATADDLADDLSLDCHHCGTGTFRPDEPVAIDDENGWWWHMEPTTLEPKGCRKAWLDRHHPPPR